MITQIKGRLIEKSPTQLVIDCNGIGYSVNISLYTFSKLSEDENIKVFTHLIIKEDSQSLFGFLTKGERELFQLLISVSGVGASTARVMLSSLSPSEIISAIANEKVSIVQSIKGIGLKTAQRIILELKDKILGIENNENDFELIPKEIEEAISALEVLGYSRKQTTKLVSKIKSDEPEISTEALIKRSLNNL